MSEKHLQKGDALPDYNDKPRLFAMRFCPYAQRAILVLNAKKVTYDLVFINLDSKPDWYFSFSPRGTVPALEYEKGKAIFDSGIINVYVDEKYPENPLQSTCPLRRAYDKMIVENLGRAYTAYYTAAFRSSELEPSMADDFHRGLEVLQKEIEHRGTKFLHGATPGLVDYTIWPYLERFECLPALGKTEFALDKEKYTVLIAYVDAMKQDPAVKAYILSPETHAKFASSKVQGNPEYNMLDSSTSCCIRPRKKKE